jgi:hypothetical protein
MWDWLILSLLFDQMNGDEISYGHFMQEHKMAHMDALDETVSKCVKSWGLCSPQSPNLNPCNFICGAH